MGLFGALFAGVSGLDSQSNKIGVISNNISNVNTVGYKQGDANFDTLVVPSGTTSFSPGGVIGGNRQLVNQQGVISATTSATDVAISGSGLIVVNTKADGTGQTLYTRSGSFTQDSQGNFVNSDGYYLQALPIDQTTGLAEQANPQNLVTAAVSQSATGAATATSTLTVAANLNAAQATLLGAPVAATMSATNGTSPVNVGATATQILVGNDVPGVSTTNNITRGDTISFTSAGTGSTTDTYTYGGFAIGRNVTTNDQTPESSGTPPVAGGLGDGNNVLNTETNQTVTVNGDTTITVSVPAANIGDYTVGGYASVSGITANISALTPAELNGEWQIKSKGANSITLQLASTSTGGVSTMGPATSTVSNRTYPFTGNILNATSVTSDFMGAGSLAINPANLFTPKALAFSISVNGNTPAQFTYSATPDPANGTFNNLTTLAQAISDSDGLTATVEQGRLYVSADDANLPITITNGDATGNGTLAGINWTQELDLPSSLPVTTPPTGTKFFNSLQGLADQINNTNPTDPNLVATVSNPKGTASLVINEANPEQTLTVSDGVAGSSVLSELGIKNLSPINNDPTQPLSTGLLGITYSPTDATKDMSSGSVAPQYSKDVTVYDAQGHSHTIAMNFLKLGTNEWAMELTAVPASDVDSSVKNNSGVGDGQIAAGILKFDGNGNLLTATGLDSTIPLTWTNGSTSGQLTLNLGEGTTGGIIQSAAAFGVSTATQNGSPVGELTGVSIDKSGFVIASFSNGQTQQMFQVPLASVNNPDGLEAVSGDAYIQTISSGIANLQLAGTSGVGTFTPSALEQSNVDLSTQLTDLIVAQQAYGANSKVLTVADSLLQELDQIIQ